jgi:hypothetical protein
MIRESQYDSSLEREMRGGPPPPGGRPAGAGNAGAGWVLSLYMLLKSRKSFTRPRSFQLSGGALRRRRRPARRRSVPLVFASPAPRAQSVVSAAAARLLAFGGARPRVPRCSARIKRQLHSLPPFWDVKRCSLFARVPCLHAGIHTRKKLWRARFKNEQD